MVATWPSFLYLVLALIHPGKLTEAKVQRGFIEFSGGSDNDRWHFLSKFGYAIGDGRYRVRTRLRQGSLTPAIPYLDFHVFLDETWNRVGGQSSCGSKVAEAKRTQPLYLPEPGEWSHWTVGTVSQRVRPHIWYFALSDCDQQIGHATLYLEYELHMIQIDGTEFSIEMRSMIKWHGLLLLGLAMFSILYSVRCLAFSHSTGGLHPVIWLLTTAISLQFSAQVLHTLHLWMFKADGAGATTLDLLAEVLFMLSQVTQTTLLVAIAMGYTLLPSRTGLAVTLKLVAFLSLTVHTLLVTFGKLHEQSEFKYHENEGAIGWMLLSIRLLLLLWFLLAVRASQRKGGPRLAEFFQRFTIAGTTYFLAYPILFLTVQMCAPYLRHPIMHIGLFLMQSASNVWLADLFLSRSTYFKVSALSVPLLPGNGSSGPSVIFDKSS